jgi:acetyl/propionyl-CoA carboxylase alpha subunit
MSYLKEVRIDGFDAIKLENLEESLIHKVSDNEYLVNYQGENINIRVSDFDPINKTFTLYADGIKLSGKGMNDLDLLVESLGFLTKAKHNIKEIKAPMPGLVIDILVAVGDEKEEGSNIIVLEAMKMENILKAEGEGKVAAVLVKKGDSVVKGQVLVRFE